MGVAGFFKKVKNAVKTVGKKIDKGIKTVVNTGAKVVSKVADVASDVASVVAPIGTLMSLAPGPVGVAGKVISGVGNLVKYGGKAVEWAANKVDDAIPDNTRSSNNVNTTITTNSTNKVNSITNKANSAINSTINRVNSAVTNTVNKQQLYTEPVGIRRQYKPMQSRPDVIVNNAYNRGPRRDYVQQRHPSNPHYNVRNIGPRRLRQPPIMNTQQPIDIQRRNYNTRRNTNYYSNNGSSNAAISW